MLIASIMAPKGKKRRAAVLKRQRKRELKILNQPGQAQSLQAGLSPEPELDGRRNRQCF
jgi:hypothetical protein